MNILMNMRIKSPKISYLEDIKNPFITSEFADEIGLTDFMEHLGEVIWICGRTKYGEILDEY